jgi:hypothetical protein
LTSSEVFQLCDGRFNGQWMNGYRCQFLREPVPLVVLKLSGHHGNRPVPSGLFSLNGPGPSGGGSSSEVPAIGRLCPAGVQKPGFRLNLTGLRFHWVIQLKEKIWLRPYPLLPGRLPADLADHGF